MAYLHPDKLAGLSRSFNKKRKRRGLQHALSQGRGRKVGLRRRLGQAVPPPPGQANQPSMIEKLAARSAVVEKARKPKLTGTANAMTRGKGRKVGLHRKAGTTPPPPPGRAKKKAKARKDGVAS